MLGAITGDIIGSPYERNPHKRMDFPLFRGDNRFTDDTVLTVALAGSILTGSNWVDKLKEYFSLYPNAGYGGLFFRWAISKSRDPYNAWSNGAGMRVSPVGFAYNSLEDVLEKAKNSAEVTHSHPEGIRGAQAVASSIFLARTGESRKMIRGFVQRAFGYDLSKSIEEIRPDYRFDVSCEGSVPQAITAALESADFEDAIRKAISLGGDSDTLACMAGGIAQALYGYVPEHILTPTLEILDDKLRGVVERFERKYFCNK